MVGSRPVSRVLSRAIIHLRESSPTHCSDLPGSTFGTDVAASLFGLAPDGVYPASTVTSAAVRSYRTISPLPHQWRYLFCGTFRGLAPPRRYLASCPMEPGLSSTHCAAITRPTPACTIGKRCRWSKLVGAVDRDSIEFVARCTRRFRDRLRRDLGCDALRGKRTHQDKRIDF